LYRIRNEKKERKKETDIHDQTGLVSCFPAGPDFRVQQRLKGFLQEVHKGGGEDDAGPKVLSDKDDDLWDLKHAAYFRQRRKRDRFSGACEDEMREMEWCWKRLTEEREEEYRYRDGHLGCDSIA
jgi:hypothetical protein